MSTGVLAQDVTHVMIARITNIQGYSIRDGLGE